MNSFTYHVPTVIHFGKGRIRHLEEVRQSGKKLLLVYGGGSIRRNGIYEDAMEILKKCGIRVWELPGVEPNPRIQLVREGVKICREQGIEMVLAIGGGSSIDTAKLVAAGALYEGDAWELMEDPAKITGALPVYVVLTLAATGSEMDNSTVISDMTKAKKLDIVSDYLKPKMAILDPTYTFTVSPKQTAAGAVDIMSHVFESYFTPVEGADVQAHICEALLRTVIENAPIALAHPEDYKARANLMWASSLALNGLISLGQEVDWCVHPIQYELGARYDITHGIGLAILTPAWMEEILSGETAGKLADYGRNVWGIEGFSDRETARCAIDATRRFFRMLGMPEKLSEIGITDCDPEEMAEACEPLCRKAYVPLTREQIAHIYRSVL